MKFNEKLIELRKKGGLSQEDLAYKFNVTRQTISKWELGQTTPEMEKLVEISKFFNISIDELINDTETNSTNAINENSSNATTATENIVIEDRKVEEKDTKKKRAIIIGVVVVAIVVLLGFAVVTPVYKKANDVFDTVTGTLEENEKQNEGFWTIFNKIFGLIDEQIEDTNKSEKKHEVTMFNLGLTSHQGTNRGSELKDLIDSIVTKNKTQSRKIVLVFNKQNLTETEQMIAIKKQIVEHKDYEVDLQYDNDGYIYQVNIEETDVTNAEDDFSEEVLDGINQMEQDMNKIDDNSDEIFNQIFNQVESKMNSMN